MTDEYHPILKSPRVSDNEVVGLLKTNYSDAEALVADLKAVKIALTSSREGFDADTFRAIEFALAMLELIQKNSSAHNMQIRFCTDIIGMVDNRIKPLHDALQPIISERNARSIMGKYMTGMSGFMIKSGALLTAMTTISAWMAGKI